MVFQLAGPLSDYSQCHNGMAHSRSEHMQRWCCFLAVFWSWRRVASPFWKLRLMTAVAPTLIHFGAISVEFIMRSLRFTILIELSQGFYAWRSYICLCLRWGRVSWDHNHASLEESWVSSGGQTNSTLISAEVRAYFINGTNGRGWGLGHASFPIWPGSILS